MCPAEMRAFSLAWALLSLAGMVHSYHAHVGFAASMFPGNLSSQCEVMRDLAPCRLFTTWNTRIPNGTAQERCHFIRSTAGRYNVSSFGLMVRGWPLEEDFALAACIPSPTIAAYGPSNTYSPIPSYLGPLVAKYGVRVAMHTQEQGINMTKERWVSTSAAGKQRRPL